MTASTAPPSILDQFIAFGRMSVTQVSDDLKINNGTVYTEVSKLVAEGKLIEVGKEGRSKLYGVPATNSEGQN